MRLCCTPESAEDREITFLAVAETLLAVSVSLLFVKVLGTATHIAVGALIAPFLLLRTEESTAAAYNIFDSCFIKLTRPVSFLAGVYERLPPALRAFIFFFVVLPLFALALAIVKSIATVLSVSSSPREAIRAIPDNWLRVTLATDSWHPPELLPQIETTAELPASAQVFRYNEIRQRITSGPGGNAFKRFALFAIYAPVVLYRFFLKSTSLVYFPLIWVSEVPLTVKGVLSLPVERVRRWYAFAVLVVMLSPLVITFHAQDTLASAQERAIFRYVLPVDKSDWWHVSRVLAVAATVALYFYARTLNADSLQNPERERWIIVGTNRFRSACGMFTMACFLLIVLTL
jgi:hypothetical protein